MWSMDIINALQKYDELGIMCCIYEIKAVYDGILIKLTSGETYKYNTSTNSFYKVPNWKKGE